MQLLPCQCKLLLVSPRPKTLLLILKGTFPPCQLIKHTIQQVSNEAAWTNVTCTFTKLWSSHHHKTWGKYSKLLSSGSFFPLRCQLISDVQCLCWITFVWETFWSDGIHVWLMSWERWTTHLRKKKKILASEIWLEVFLGEAQIQIAAETKRKSFMYP